MTREAVAGVISVAEQRGYDRAIAEVVAMLARMAAEDISDRHEGLGDAGTLEEAKRAIEAGEHKP